MGKTKEQKLDSVIESMLSASEYCLVHVKKEYEAKSLSKKDCDRIVNNLVMIGSILRQLRFDQPFKNDNLTMIRIINYSLKPFYLENEYDLISNAAMSTNGMLCHEPKGIDSKLIDRLKKLVKMLPNSYQFCFKNAVINLNDELNFDRRQDNLHYLGIKYIPIKYHFKPVKSSVITINGKNQACVDEFSNLIQAKDTSDDDKEYFTRLRDYVLNYANAELVIVKLKEIIKLCTQDEFSNIKEIVKTIIDKYQEVYNENRLKYNLEKQSSNTKGKDDSEHSREKEILLELSKFLHSVDTKQENKSNKNVK